MGKIGWTIKNCNMRREIFSSLLLIFLFLLPFTVIAKHQQYLVVSRFYFFAYNQFDGDFIRPGDNVKILAELYEGEQRLSNNVKVTITGYTTYNPFENVDTNISLNVKENHVFEIDFKIPSVVTLTSIHINIIAHFNNDIVGFDSVTIQISQEKPIPVSPPLHSLSKRPIQPGDTVKLHSFIPDIKTRDMDSSNVKIDIEFRTPGAVNGSIINKKSNYVGDGTFEVSYKLPPEFNYDINSMFTPRLIVDVEANYGGEKF
jgi:hypothetical protein